MHGVQQIPGQGFKEKGMIGPDDGDTTYIRKFQREVNLTTNKSISNAHMKLSNLRIEDMALYNGVRDRYSVTAHTVNMSDT